MNSEKELPENQFDKSVRQDSSDVDDFLKELEEKEKDLEISSDIVFEIEESDISESDEMELLKFLESCEEEAATKRKAELPVTDYQEFNEKVLKTGNEVAELKAKISVLEAEKTEMSESVRRQKNEFENYRKRSERERSEVFRSIIGDVANQLLPVIDNLGRALDSTVSDESSKELQQFRDGIALVNQQLYEVLGEMGIQPIKSVGEPFDPHLHEAVAAEQTDKFPPHTVITELLRGFRLDDKVIRHSLVKVSKMPNPETVSDEVVTE